MTAEQTPQPGYADGYRQALKDVETEVRLIPCWGDGKGHSGFDVGDDPVRHIREVIRGMSGSA